MTDPIAYTTTPLEALQKELATLKINPAPLPESAKDRPRARLSTSPNNKCGECAHLYPTQHARTYYKCDLHKNTNSANSDWRKTWPACGRFTPKDGLL